MAGAIAPNLHEGFRSEYLAQYVFSAFGTAVSVPAAEDHGLDLLCTFVERDGQRAWSHTPYSVQIKSSMDPWKFEGNKSVSWFIKHPSPIFFCVVDKKSGRIRVFHTFPRFAMWVRDPAIISACLVPGTESNWQALRLPKEGCDISLGAPILDFSIEQFLDPRFAEKVKQTLLTWAAMDDANIKRQRNGITNFKVPIKWAPNTEPNPNSTATFGHFVNPVADDRLEEALPNLGEALAFFGSEALKRGDMYAAALSVLLHRSVFPGDLFPKLNEINDEVSLQSDRYSHNGIERLETIMHQAIDEARRLRDDRNGDESVNKSE